MSFAEVEIDVIRWGEARGIVQNGKPVGQARKTLEETGELIEALARVSTLKEVATNFPALEREPLFQTMLDKAKAEVKDAVGDILVTTTMVCATSDIDQTECFKLAYNEIKDRRGYLRPDGVFVKEA